MLILDISSLAHAIPGACTCFDFMSAPHCRTGHLFPCRAWHMKENLFWPGHTHFGPQPQ